MQDQENQEVSNQPEAADAAAAAAAQAAPANEPGLEEQLSATEAKLAEMHDAFMRAKAEADNIRRRAQEDVSKAHKFAIESFAEAMVMANVAASIVVRRFGTSVTTVEEMKSAWEGLHQADDPALRRAKSS